MRITGCVLVVTVITAILLLYSDNSLSAAVTESGGRNSDYYMYGNLFVINLNWSYIFGSECQVLVSCLLNLKESL